MATSTHKPARLFLDAETAHDLMNPEPLTVDQNTTIHDAAALLTDKEISAVPIIDDAGRAVGVVSRADIVGHPQASRSLTTVRAIMTPVVFHVAPTTSVTNVIEEMLARRVHRLFVIHDNGELIGVISTLDILGRLRG